MGVGLLSGAVKWTAWALSILKATDLYTSMDELYGM